MKLKSLFLGIFLLVGMAGAFAGVNASKGNKKTETVKKAEFKNVRTWVPTSCTVKITYGSVNVSITASCTCKQTEACDQAYAIARLAVFNR